MSHYTDDDFWNPPEQDRPTFVEAKLNSVGVSLKTRDVLGGRTEDSREAERKAKRAREQLAKEDRLFNVTRECTIGVPWTAGDPEGQADAGD